MAVEKRKRSDSVSETVTVAPAKSVLKSSEISFPRGGASVLTPLEVKEVANEAARDVLFEASGKSKPLASETPKKKQKTVHKKKKSATTSTESETNTISIEHIDFKKLLPGSLVLGQVCQINRMDLALSISDNLVGYVPITSISEEITAQLESIQDELDQDSSDEEDEELEDDSKAEFPSLRKLFKIGDWLRAKVVEDENSKKGKKRIQLTIEPEEVNKSLEDEDLIQGNTLQVSVGSIEDHGCILNTGKDKNGFISKKELKNGDINIEDLKVGSVLLTSIAKDSTDARTITCKIPTGAVKKQGALSTTSSVDALLPGVLVDALIVEVQNNGLLAKVFGVIEATINLTHTGIYNFSDLKHRFSVGSTIRSRVLFSYTRSGQKRVMLTLLPHVLSMDATPYNKESDSAPLDAFAIGHVFEEVEIKGYDSRYIYADVGNKTTLGQAHISKLNENEVVDVEYKIGTKHNARIIGYSQLDNFYVLTFDKNEIKKPFLRVQDIPTGSLCNAEILKVVPEGGISLKIFDEFDAYVPRIHMSDVKLIYPERKFKIGSKVKGRILKITHPKGGKSNVMVTFKKSLVNADDDEIVSSINDLEVGKRLPATVEKFVPSGCVVSFFGSLRGFLPKAEISETFVRKPEDHLKLGQTVKVRVLTVEPENRKLIVSCRASDSLSEAQKDALTSIIPGKSIIKVVIVQKEKDSLVVEMPEHNLRGVLAVGHLSDKNIEQNRADFKKLEIGSTIEDVMVLEKDSRARVLNLTAKKSLVEDVKANGSIPTVFEDIVMNDKILHGYIKSVTAAGVFVSFANRLTGLVLPKYYNNTDKSFYVYQSVDVKALKLDSEKRRFLLTMNLQSSDSNSELAINPVDKSIKTLDEYSQGKVTKAIVKSVKVTQLNVELADNQQARIDISQVFDDVSEIKDLKHPLSQFEKDQVIDVRVIGFHDARNHRFLPISHRKNKHLIVELSAKKSDLDSKKSVRPLTLADTKVGSKWTAFVNNFARSYLWVNITPSIRGRISLMNLSDDASTFEDLDKHYPLGSALDVTVEEVDTEHNALTLSSRSNPVTSIKDVKVGQVLPAKVLKTKDTYVLVEVGSGVTASAFITDALNDYSEKLESVFSTNDICAATILEIDESKNKISVSLRTKDVKDKLVSSIDDLNRGDVVRGFVKNIADNGVYVSLGRSVFGLVRISDLSDSYIKEWKKFFKPHQPVIAKVINAAEEGRVLLTLKESEVNGDLNILKSFSDLKVGDIFEGSVKLATEFGVFVKLDNTLNVNGLCHQTEISDNAVTDVKALFGEGDRVKVKILKINAEKKQLSLGMKASYFTSQADEDYDVEMSQEEEEEEESESEAEVEPVKESVKKVSQANDSDDEDEVMEDYNESEDSSRNSDSDSESESEEESKASSGLSAGLSTNGFDWTASILDQSQPADESSSEDEDFAHTTKRNKKKKKQQIVEDKTAALNTRAPQSVADFERLLVGNPNSSILWMNYMSFQLQLSEIDKAREIAERALKTINYRDEQEKLNIWIARLNMENTFGTDDTLEDVFKNSCQYMEASVMYQKLIAIYIMSEKFDKADELFQKALKKFSREISFWVSYGSFLLDQRYPDRCHQLLERALGQLPKSNHVEIVRKFAQLEYSKGEAEQGRSLFEGIISDAPKRIDIWNVYIDQEIKLSSKEDKSRVEELFERVVEKKLSRKQAKFFFGKWLSFEESMDDTKACDYVKAKAVEYSEAHKE